jgi:hypothetical protein
VLSFSRLVGQTLYAPSASIGSSSVAGNVGVGTPSPQEKLEVSGGNVRVSGVLSPYIMLKSNGSGGAYGFLQFNGAEGNFMRLFDGGDYAMTWRSGLVGIGTAQPADKFHVRVTSSDTGIFLDDGGANFNPSFRISRGGVSRLLLAATTNTGTVSGLGGSGLVLSGNNAGQDVVITAAGQVGVGTATPSARLHVQSGGGGPATTYRDLNIGGIGGWTSGEEHTIAAVYSLGDIGRITFKYDSTIGGSFNIDNLLLPSGNNSGKVFTVTSLGRVGIGTTNPTEKLSVNGAVRAKEVIVETTGWSDYVFEENYTLAPLSQVEKYITQHKRLPNIPSSRDVAEQGVSLGDMQAKLLAKIEELTLHQIALEKRVVALESENAQLKSAHAK